MGRCMVLRFFLVGERGKRGLRVKTRARCFESVAQASVSRGHGHQPMHAGESALRATSFKLTLAYESAARRVPHCPSSCQEARFGVRSLAERADLAGARRPPIRTLQHWLDGVLIEARRASAGLAADLIGSSSSGAPHFEHPHRPRGHASSLPAPAPHGRLDRCEPLIEECHEGERESAARRRRCGVVLAIAVPIEVAGRGDGPEAARGEARGRRNRPARTGSCRPRVGATPNPWIPRIDATLPGAARQPG